MRQTKLTPTNRGFYITYENGYELSVQYGYGNYCSNRGLGDFTGEPRHGDLPRTPNIEIAIEDTSREGDPFIVIPMDVHGFVCVDDLHDIMRCVRNADFRSLCAIIGVDYIMDNDPTLSPTDIKEVNDKIAAADDADTLWGDN